MNLGLFSISYGQKERISCHGVKRRYKIVIKQMCIVWYGMGWLSISDQMLHVFLVENIADRHSIRTNGGYWLHQIPSKPSRGTFTSQHSLFLSFHINILFSSDILIRPLIDYMFQFFFFFFFQGFSTQLYNIYSIKEFNEY